MYNNLTVYYLNLTIYFPSLSLSLSSGWIGWVIAMFFSFQLTGFPFYQEKWPGHNLYKRIAAKDRSMFVRIPGWNDHDPRAKVFDDAQALKAGGTIEEPTPDVSVSSAKMETQV